MSVESRPRHGHLTCLAGRVEGVEPTRGVAVGERCRGELVLQFVGREGGWRAAVGMVGVSYRHLLTVVVVRQWIFRCTRKAWSGRTSMTLSGSSPHRSRAPGAPAAGGCGSARQVLAG